MNTLKKGFTVFSVVTMVALFSINTAFAWHHHESRAKNVIILVPDGCSQSIQTLARWYKLKDSGEKLALDDIQVGVVKHEMANSVITGSAAAATAFSTGYKTTVRFLSVGPRADDVLSTYEWPEDPDTFSYKPLATVMEGAKLKGKATGLISTSRFTHATPAAWACHSADRGNEHTDISEHMVYNEIDLIFGGGERNLVPLSAGGKRPDEEDLLQVLVDRGYDIARTEAEMNALTDLPVYGMFAWSHMDAEIDRPIYNPDEPSLADMTAKAIELLSQDRDGFILMVEGSEVDWAGHNNDPIYMVTDFIEFDEAVKVALDFAKADGETLVLAYPDHNTGGMDIGNRDYNGAYTHLTVEELVDPLMGMSVTAGALAAEIAAMPGGVTVPNIQTKTLELWNLNVSDEVAQEIIDLTGVQEGQDGYTISFDYALARVISKHYTAIGWTSHGHNAEDVPVWAYGPGAPRGLVDNTELAETVADVFGLNMERIQDRLFVNLDDAFGEWTLDETDPANPVAKLSGKFAEAELPCSKDLLTIKTTSGKTKTYNLEGVVVYAPNTGRVYVPRQAVRIMKLHGIG
ncbi:MAG TPA: alkaline phosphatase [Desulfobacterales bacterium]|nr:alkaline phosphatase [Desulfobacterales bacterium]